MGLNREHGSPGKQAGKEGKQRGLRRREEDAEEEATQPHGGKRNEKISGGRSSRVSCGQRAGEGGAKMEGWTGT